MTRSLCCIWRHCSKWRTSPLQSPASPSDGKLSAKQATKASGKASLRNSPCSSAEESSTISGTKPLCRSRRKACRACRPISTALSRDVPAPSPARRREREGERTTCRTPGTLKSRLPRQEAKRISCPGCAAKAASNGPRSPGKVWLTNRMRMEAPADAAKRRDGLQTAPPCMQG